MTMRIYWHVFPDRNEEPAARMDRAIRALETAV
jgi:hypothetical protein